MRRNCPRCNGLITHSYASESPHCMNCGWTDYEYTVPKANKNTNAWLGTSVRLRYVGVTETDLHPMRKGSRNGQIRDYIVTLLAESIPRQDGLGYVHKVRPLCPFCLDASPMDRISMRGHRRNRTEERYRCQLLHVIGLISDVDTDGTQGSYSGWV